MIAASVVYFAYMAGVSLWLPGLSRAGRTRAAASSSAGLALSFIAAAATTFWLRSVVLPLLLLLLGYWTSGLLWVKPNPTLEQLLGRFDRALNLPRGAARLPRPLCELLELSYVGIYALIPLALFLHLGSSARPDAERFWTVILVTDYVCFAMLPWIQTRPPRAIEAVPQCPSRLRRLNVALLDRTSIGANTVPSGHAAEALAIALLLADASGPVVVAGVLAALLVSSGAVAGRYHYALDVLAGWATAVIVFVCYS